MKERGKECSCHFVDSKKCTRPLGVLPNVVVCSQSCIATPLFSCPSALDTRVRLPHPLFLQYLSNPALFIPLRRLHNPILHLLLLLLLLFLFFLSLILASLFSHFFPFFPLLSSSSLYSCFLLSILVSSLSHHVPSFFTSYFFGLLSPPPFLIPWSPSSLIQQASNTTISLHQLQLNRTPKTKINVDTP